MINYLQTNNNKRNLSVLTSESIGKDPPCASLPPLKKSKKNQV